MKDMTIRVKLDRSSAAQSTKEHIQDAKKMETAIKESFAEQRKAIADNYKAIAEGIKATNKEIEKDEKDVRKRIAADSVQRGRDAAKAIAQAQGEAAKAGHELEIMESKKALTNHEVIQKARVSLIEDENKKRIDSTKAQMIAFREAVANQKSGWGIMADGAKSAGMAVLGFIKSYATIGTVTQVVSTIANMWHDQRKDIENSVEALRAYREQALAIAALKGNQGQSTGEVANQLEFRAKTLQTKDAALAFQEGLLNTGNASKDAGFISPGNLSVLAEKGGAYQATNPKYTPDAVGNLMGVLPSMIGTANQSPEDVFRRGVGIAKTFEQGSANPGPALNQFMKNTALIGQGQYESPEQLAAVQSAFSSISPDDSGTLAKQFLRGTVGGLTRMRGSQFEGSIPQSEYLRNELHAKEGMNAVDIGRLIAADLKKNQDAGGKDFSPTTYLTMKGYQDEEARMAVLGFAKKINDGSYDKTFGKTSTPGSAPSMAEAMAPINRFQNVDPVGLGRKADLSKDIADYNSAAGPEEFLKKQKEIAFQTLRGKPGSGIKGELSDWNNTLLWEGPVLDEMQRSLLERAKKSGVAVPEDEKEVDSSILLPGVTRSLGLGVGGGKLGGSASARTRTSEAERARYAYELNSQIVEANGKASNTDALLVEMRKTRESAERQEKLMAEALAKQQQGVVPPVLPVGRGQPVNPRP